MGQPSPDDVGNDKELENISQPQLASRLYSGELHWGLRSCFAAVGSFTPCYGFCCEFKKQ